MKIFTKLKLIPWIVITAILVTASIAIPQTLEQLRYGARLWQVDSAPDTPDTGEGIFYVLDNGGTMTLYFKDDQGTPTSCIAGAAADTLDSAYTAGSTITGDASGDIEIDLSVTGRKVIISNTYAGTQAAGVEIDSEAANQAITSALIFNTSGTGATIGTAIDASDAGITNVLNIGGNKILGAAGVIDFSEFDVSGTTGAIIINDDGNAGSITIEGTVLDINSLDFVGAGAITSAESTAITINPHSGDASGEDLIITAHNIQLTDAGALTCTNITATGNLAVTGTISGGTYTQDTMQAATPNGTLTVIGHGAGGVTIGSTSDGDITLGDDIVVSDTYNMTIGEGELLIDSDATDKDALEIQSSATTAGSAIKITASTTTDNTIEATANDLGTGGKIIYLSSNNMAADNFYLYAYDGGAADFSISQHGATLIAGNASGTDALTLTNGDILVTAGHIDITTGNMTVGTGNMAIATNGDFTTARGKITADTVDDEGNYFKRNKDTASTTMLLLEKTHIGDTGTLLHIDNKGTGATTTIDIDTAGLGPIIDIDASAARTGDVIDITMTNQEAEKAIAIDGAWTGTTGEGLIDVHVTGNLAGTASLLRLDYDTGTKAAAGDGFMLTVADDSPEKATSYAVNIGSANNEGLKVSAGKVYVTEQAQFVGGLDVDDPIDIDFDAVDETVTITATADGYTAKSGVLVVEQTDTTLTNQQFLLRLQYTANDNVNGDFIICVDDNGGDKDEVFKVNSNGQITAAGSIVTTGDQIGGSGIAKLVGVRSDVVDAETTNPYAVTTAMSNATFYNSQATEFDLPEASTAIGCEYTFVVMNSSNLDVDPEAGDKILGICDAAGDHTRSSTIGDTLTLRAIDADNWIVQSIFPTSADWVDGV